MASGGHFSLSQSRNSKQSSSSSTRHARGEPCDALDPPWLLTANNLDLHASATEPRLSKKQRNKNKTRTVPVLESPISSESSPRVPCQKAASSLFTCSKFSPVPHNNAGDTVSARQWLMLSDYGEADSNTEELNAQNFQSCHRRVDSITNGTAVKRAVQDSFTKASKQDNTNKLPNTSLIVERLMHLRDLICQVTSIMQNLEKSDEPSTREQMERLDGMLDQLRHEEQEHLELLQQVLAARDIKSTQRDQDAALSPSSCSIDASSNPVRIKQEEINATVEELEEVELENHNPFLQEMIESREKLTAIKEQQATLLNMQKKAENRLAEAKAFHERIMETALPLTGEWNGGLVPELHNGTDYQDELDWDGAGEEVDTEVVQIPQPPPRKAHKGEDRSKPMLSVDIESIQHRLHLLKEVADNRKLAEVMTAAEENITQDEKVAEKHRQQLENKLRKLQEKKLQMDHLLAEISSLQTVSDQNSPPRNQLPSKEHHCQNLESSLAIQDAKKYLDVDAQDKLRKLDDMKATLKQLKEMAGNLNIAVNAEQNSAEMLQQAAQSQQRRIRSQSQKSKEKAPPRKQGALKSDNIKKENLSASFPARRHYEAEGRANEDGDNTQAAAAGPATLNGVVDDEMEIQEKVQKLQAAKHKLQKLHTLLGAMQQLQQSGEPVPNEFLNILSSLQEDESDEEDDRSIPKQAVTSSNNSLDNSNDLNQNDMSRLEEVEEKMKQQQVDLEKLMEERGRLLSMKEQLTRLQQQFPSIISKNNHQRSSGEGGSGASRRERQTRQKNLLPVRDAKKCSSRQDPNLFQQNVDERNRNLEPHPCAQAPTVRKEINSKAPPNQLSNPMLWH